MTVTEKIAFAALFINVITFIIGQVIAVKVLRYLDDKKSTKARKVAVFKTLMATRAANLSPAHVEALNSIPLEFTDKNKKDSKVREEWKSYLDLLGDRNIDPSQWGIRRVDLLVNLLSSMAVALDYNFDKVDIKNGIYSPEAHGRIENDQEAIRNGFRELLEGKRPIPMFIVNWPDSQIDAAKSDEKIKAA